MSARRPGPISAMGRWPRTLSTIAGGCGAADSQSWAPARFFPALLERRRRVDKCLFVVVTEAYRHGTSTRKVDDLVKALGAIAGCDSLSWPQRAGIANYRCTLISDEPVIRLGRCPFLVVFRRALGGFGAGERRGSVWRWDVKISRADSMTRCCSPTRRNLGAIRSGPANLRSGTRCVAAVCAQVQPARLTPPVV
jgi:Transposase, Mutator family